MSKKNEHGKEHGEVRYIIYVDWPVDAPPPRMRDMFELFEETGVKLDTKFEPVKIAINKSGSATYLIKAKANDAARKAASHLRGIKFNLENL